MPLNLAEINQQYIVQKICGDEEQRHYLETLGFVENTAVRILSVFLAITSSWSGKVRSRSALILRE